MEVFLQYWDELDDAWHTARFRLIYSRARWLVLATGLVLLASCVAV